MPVCVGKLSSVAILRPCTPRAIKLVPPLVLPLRHTVYHVISVPRRSAFSSYKRKKAGTAGFEAKVEVD